MSDQGDCEHSRRGSPVLTEHVVERWIERVCHRHADVAPWDLEEAFERAVPVGILGNDHGRLHEPTDSVIVFKRDWSQGPPVLVTVLFADKMPLNDDHLKECNDCGQRYKDTGAGECSWCSRDCQPHSTDGSISNNIVDKRK